MKISSAFLFVLCWTRASMALDNDFSSYPQGSQQCLTDAANQSKCTGNTGQQLNQCLCTNTGNFIYNSADCIAKKSPKDLETVYDTLQNNCAGTGVTLTVSKQAFLANAAAATATSAANTPTRTSTPTSTSSPANTSATTSSNTSSNTSSPTHSQGLGTGAIVGIAIGGLVVILLTAAGIRLFVRRRRSRKQVQPHLPTTEFSPYPSYNQDPMLKYAQHGGAAELDNSEHTPALLEAYSTKQSDAKRKDHSNTPLLAELGDNQNAQHTRAIPSVLPPAELPADEYLHGRPGQGR